MKPIFLYLKSCKLSDRQLKKLVDAGYVTLPVDSFDSVQIAEPLLVGCNQISKAAFETIANSSASSGYAGQLWKACSKSSCDYFCPMTTENQDQPPVNPNPASSLPQQEKRWTTNWMMPHGLFVELRDGDGNVIDDSFHDMESANKVRDAHNATLSEPKPEVKEEQAELKWLRAIHGGTLKEVLAEYGLSGIPDAPADNAQAVLQKKRVGGIVIPSGPPLTVVEVLRAFVDGIYGYEETGVWPDNHALRTWAELGKDALEGTGIPSRCFCFNCLKAIVAPSVVAGVGEHAMGVSSQGLCDTTLTERFDIGGCSCPTYEGNLGPCKMWLLGWNGRCPYCDHTKECHDKVSEPKESEE